MLYLTGIIINFFLGVILIGKKNKSEADKILTAWLLFMGLHLSSFYLFVTQQYAWYPHLLGIGIPFPLLHGPFLYLYTSSLTDQVSDRRMRWMHFLPFVLAYIPLSSFLFTSAEHKIFTYENNGAGYEWFIIPMNMAVIVSGITYVLLSLRKLYRHRKNITDQFSNTDKINLVWLRYLIAGLGCIWVAVIFGNDNYVFALAVLYVLFIGYFGIKQTTIFAHHTPVLKEDLTVKADLPVNTNTESRSLSAEPDIVLNAEKGKYQKSGLDENELQQIHGQLTALMQRERLYTNPELTLGDTAQQLNVHPNYLSQVINSVAKKNFYDYINSQRIEEFNRAVKETKNQKFTLLSLAFECGFNSKTSFNRNFRKVMGVSPSEYLKQMNVNFEEVN